MICNKNAIKVGYILSVTRIKRSGILSNLLIIVVMTLTFLNLLVVRGILIGLPAGAVKANRENYYADVFISTKDSMKHINNSENITKILDNIDGVEHYATRYITSATATADYKKRLTKDEKPNQINTKLVAIDPKDEEIIVNISQAIIEGKLFNENSKDEIVLGKDLLTKYEGSVITGNSTLDNVNIGTTIQLKVGENIEELKVVGFAGSKVNEIDAVMLISKDLMRDLLPRDDFKPDEIAIRITPDSTPQQVQNEIVAFGIPPEISVETPEEYQPSFVEDIIDTFAILGDVIGSISLIVAAITVFIIIFVNAITQKKQIGILKGIGICPFAVELSYILQALLYVTIGAAISIPILYFVLVPYFVANPIDFPFSDGVIVAEYASTFTRTVLMFIVTGIAGYVPAKYIVDQNTLDAILGRK